MNGVDQQIRRERLGKERAGPRLGSLAARMRAVDCAHEYRGRVDAGQLQPPAQLEPAHAGHTDIDDEHVYRGCLGRRQELLTRAELEDFQVRTPQETTDCGADEAIVIDD